MEIWIMFTGTNTGDRESCSIFYTDKQVFTSKAKAKEHAAVMKRRYGGKLPEFYTEIHGPYELDTYKFKKQAEDAPYIPYLIS